MPPLVEDKEPLDAEELEEPLEEDVPDEAPCRLDALVGRLPGVDAIDKFRNDPVLDMVVLVTAVAGVDAVGGFDRPETSPRFNGVICTGTRADL